MLPDNSEAFLQLRRDGILHPEEVKRLEFFAQTRRLDRRKPMMAVVQQMHIFAELLAHSLE